jgi:hypothetical protein
MSEPKKPLSSISASEIAARDVPRRTFFRDAGVLMGTVGVAPVLTGCCDFDTTDADVTRIDSDPYDPATYADPPGDSC